MIQLLIRDRETKKLNTLISSFKSLPFQVRLGSLSLVERMDIHSAESTEMTDNSDNYALPKEYEPAEMMDALNSLYVNFTAKMSSFFVVATIVIIIYSTIKWFLRTLASLAWLITIVFVTMYLLPALREGKLDDIAMIFGNILYAVFAEGKKLAFKLIRNYTEVTVEYLKS